MDVSEIRRESSVRHLKGVKGVSNAIFISPVVSPGQVKALIDDALRRSAEVDAACTHVEADKGTVTLTGKGQVRGRKDRKPNARHGRLLA